jgi:hypothetical protein
MNREKVNRIIGAYSREDRMLKIAECKKREEVNAKKVRISGDIIKLPAFRIPLNLIRFNPFNGRIVVLSKENGLHELNNPIENIDVQIQIIDFLWGVNKPRNEETQISLMEGQMEPAVITKDGILIDGNRRASLILKNLHDGNHERDYLEAVVLDIEYGKEGRSLLEKLETEIQIGEEKKLDYGAIEKYIKVDQMINDAGVSIEDVAKAFGEKPIQVDRWLKIKTCMDDYLDYIHAPGRYSRLDSMEESFIEFQKLWSNIEMRRGVAPGINIERRQDKENFKKTMFSIMRYSSNETDPGKKIEQKSYVRPILMPDSRNSKSLLGKPELANEMISKFVNEVFPKIDRFDREVTIDSLREQYPNVSTQELYKIRDQKWCAETEQISSLVKRAVNKAGAEYESDKPIEYIEDSFKKLSKVLTLDDNGIVNFKDNSTRLKIEESMEEYSDRIKILAKMADFLKRQLN